MKIRVNTKDLESAIKKLDLVRPNKSKLKILENIKIEAGNINNSHITLTSTDLENTLEIKLDAYIEEAGEGILSNITNIKKSFKYFNHFETIITTDNDDITLINDKKEIKNSTFKPSEYPESIVLKDHDTYTYNTTSLYNRVLKVLPATSKDETRPILTGICFRDSDLVAIDGFRVHVNKDYNLNVNKSFVVPANLLQVFTKLIGKKDNYDLNILVNDKHIQLQYENITLTGRLLEGEFVDYNKIISKNYNTLVKINKDDLKENIEFLGTYDRLIRFNFNNNITEFNVSNETGSYKAEANNNYFEGDNIKIVANNNYIKDAINCIDDKEVRIEMTSNLSPIVFKSNDDKELYLVLPIRMAS